MSIYCRKSSKTENQCTCTNSNRSSAEKIHPFCQISGGFVDSQTSASWVTSVASWKRGNNSAHLLWRREARTPARAPKQRLNSAKWHNKGNALSRSLKLVLRNGDDLAQYCISLWNATILKKNKESSPGTTSVSSRIRFPPKGFLKTIPQGKRANFGGFKGVSLRTAVCQTVYLIIAPVRGLWRYTR